MTEMGFEGGQSGSSLGSNMKVGGQAPSPGSNKPLSGLDFGSTREDRYEHVTNITS